MSKEMIRERFYKAGWLFPAVLVYCECLFHLSVKSKVTGLDLLLTVLFSCGYGFLLQLIRSFLPEGKIKKIVTGVLLFLCALPFLIAYFIYVQFGMVYDLTTVFYAGADATENYGGEITRMVSGLSGFFHIILFLLPLILYVVWQIRLSRKEEEAEDTVGAKDRIRYGVLALVCVLLPTLLIWTTPVLREPYAERYQYTDVVRQYGLLTAIRRDATRIVTGANKNASFTVVAQSSLPDEEETALQEAGANTTEKAEATYGDEPEVEVNVPTEEEPVEKVYDYNKLDINFRELSEKTGGTMANIDSYVSTLRPSKQSQYTGMFKGKNLIFLCAESFSGAMIDEELTPTLYRMQTKGIVFNDFYQPFSASTTGGEYQILLGLQPMSGAASMDIATNYHNYMTLGSFLTREGYYGKMFHNGDNTYYNRDRTHNALGYSEPYMAFGSGLEKMIEWNIWDRKDKELIEKTFPLYKDEEHFNIYYMTYSGHLPYYRGNNPVVDRHFDRVEDLEYNDEVKGYIAANLELEDAVTRLVELLEEEELLEDTVIVICPDHYPYGLDGAQAGHRPNLETLFGNPVTNDLERDKTCLLIWTPELEENDPIVVDEPVGSIDILPTLLNLFGCPFDSRLFAGVDALSDAPHLVFNISYDWKTEDGTYVNATGVFTPAEGVDPEKLPEDYVEQMRTTVSNKMEYCRSLTYNDYFYHLFGDMTAESAPWIKDNPYPEAE